MSVRFASRCATPTGSTEKSAAVLCNETAYRGGAFGPCRAFHERSVPNITNVFYGRDVGYSVERILLDEATEAISASKVRALSAGP